MFVSTHEPSNSRASFSTESFGAPRFPRSLENISKENFRAKRGEREKEERRENDHGGG